jgi:hypothetical protein
MTRSSYIIAFLLLPLGLLQEPSKDAAPPEDIESARVELQKKWAVDGLIKPKEVLRRGSELFARELDEQSEEDLQALVKQANAAANYVGVILDEYASYYSDNYRSELIQKRVAQYHDAYVSLSNRLKTLRDQAYFNLGKKAAARGEEISAFFLFRDAFRFSSFTEPQGDHKGIRYLAEIEMKKLLDIEGIGTFLYWE